MAKANSQLTKTVLSCGDVRGGPLVTSDDEILIGATTVSQKRLVAAPEAAMELSCEAARLGGVVRGCEDRVPDGLLSEAPAAASPFVVETGGFSIRSGSLGRAQSSRQSVTGRRPTRYTESLLGHLQVDTSACSRQALILPFEPRSCLGRLR